MAEKFNMHGTGRFTKFDLLSILICLVFLCTLLSYGPFDVEEYQQGVFASKIHFSGLFKGHIPFWEFDMGFGTPLPIVHRFDLHPIIALFPFFSDF